MIDDEKIIAVNEERLSREKYHRGFPERSIKKVLELFDGKPEDIDRVAVAGIYRKKKRLLKMKNGIERMIGNPQKMINVEHHLAHAAGAYYTGGWDRTTVLTIDAAGDGLSSTVYSGEDGRLKKIAQSSYLDSLGDFYASITDMLGFVPMRHEGKIMALGAMDGVKKYDFSNCLSVNGMSFENRTEVTGSECTRELAEKTDFPLNRKDECANVLRKGKMEHELSRKAVDIASSAQSHLEKSLNELCRNLQSSGYLDEASKQRIAYSGGVAQNVKGNAVLKENFDECWVSPHMGDGGLALGAALYVNSELNSERIMWDWKGDVKNVYLGPRYETENLLSDIEARKELKIEEPKNIEKRIAEELSRGNTVCLFQGKMEYGPRALGNRSILADPSKEEMKEHLNNALGREPFQPFSPTILEGYKKKYLKDPTTNKFMTMSYETTEIAKKDMPATVHVDGTTRAQIIDKTDNELFYEIIKEFEKKTGIGAVLNTSFNLHGEPIVCGPEEAVETFEKTGLDILVLEDLILRPLSSR